MTRPQKISLSLSTLEFKTPASTVLTDCRMRMDAATADLETFERRAGTENPAFRESWAKLCSVLKYSRNVRVALDSAIDVRALALMLGTADAEKIRFDAALLKRISEIRSKPSFLLIEAVFEHYLKYYDQNEDLEAMESWLRDAFRQKAESNALFMRLLEGDGPKWLAEDAVLNGRDFDEQIRKVELDRYRSGRFLTTANSIYYLNTLKGLSSNQDHPILHEVRKPAVYEAIYDKTALIGHKVLEILIEKSPEGDGVSDLWRESIMSIAGDPRIPKNHPRFIKWWSHISEDHRMKVEGWFSRLDLKLFLEAFKDYAEASSDDSALRMFPPRKQFIEGLLQQGLIRRTRLFLSGGAKSYLKRNYNDEHLPHFYNISGQASLIYMQVDNLHVFEGTHSCKCWIYEHLDESAYVYSNKSDVYLYKSITQDMYFDMRRLGIAAFGIAHKGTWQHKVLSCFDELGLSVDPKYVLTTDDYRDYKREFGVW